MEGLPTVSSDVSVTCKCGPPTPSKEDTRLSTWQSHQEKITKIRRNLSAKTRRPQNELLMNSTKRFREIQEQRTLLAYAQIPCRFDKYRGNPNWWKVPPRLHQICCETQQYFLTWTRAEKFEIPEMEYITVADRSSGDTNKTKKPQKSLPDYALKRLDSFCVKNIQPHKPSLEDLFLVGKNPLHFEKKSSEVLLAAVDLSLNSGSGDDYMIRSVLSAQSTKKKSYIYLVLNDQKIMSDSQGVIKASVNFDAVCGGPPKTGYLHLHNRSTWTMRITLTETKRPSNFGSNNKTSTETHFFYDPNYKVIIPGQNTNIPFWFRTAKCGYYDTMLVMSIVPDLWDGKLTLQVNLNGSATDADLMEKAHSYEKMIQDRVRARMINEFLNEILIDIPPKESKIRMYTYNKKTIFEALNANFDAFHTSPKYLYNKEIVDELENFYKTVRLDKHPEFWSLVLDDLRAVTKDREQYDRVEQLETTYEAIVEKIKENKEIRDKMKVKLDEMLVSTTKTGKAKAAKAKAKSPKAKGKLDKSPKGSPKKNKKQEKALKEPEREERPKTLSDYLEEIIAKLKSQRVYRDVHCQRIKSAYHLFCGYMDKISIEIKDMCQNYFSLERLDPRMTYRNAFSLTTFKFDQIPHCEMAIKAFGNYPKYHGTPQPAWALEIPMQDFEKRFEAYENAHDDGKKKGKKGKGKKETVSVRSKETKKTQKSKKEKDVSKSTSQSPESFSKFPITINEEQEICEDWDMQNEDWYFLIPHDKVDHYRNNIYTCFYKNLCDFVDDLDDVLSLIVDSEASPAEVQRMAMLQMTQLRPDHGLEMQYVNLKEKISQILIMGDIIADEEPPLGAAVPYPDQAVKEDLPVTSSSVWDIVKAYIPKRLRRYPVHEDDIYAVRPSRADKQDADTEMGPEEVITERNIQTSLCSDISVNVNDGLLPGPLPSKEICVCGRQLHDEEVPKLVSSFHDSECFHSEKNSSSTESSSSAV